MNEEKNQETKPEEKPGAISLDDLENLSGGGGLRGATTSSTHDLSEGATK